MSVSISLLGGGSLEGSIFAIDPVTEAVVLKDSNGGYTMISPSQIAKIEGDINNIPTPNINEFGLSINTSNQQESKARESSSICLAGINHNVSDKIQTIYDKMVLIYGSNFVKWGDNNRIMILDDYSIDPPYESVTILPHAVNKVDQSVYNRITNIFIAARDKK